MIFIIPYSFVCTHTHTHTHTHTLHTPHTHTFQDYLSPVIPSGRGGAARTISAPEESMQWSIWSARPSYPGGMPRPVPPFSQSNPATSTLETLQLHHVRERQICKASEACQVLSALVVLVCSVLGFMSRLSLWEGRGRGQGLAVFSELLP